MSDYTSQDLNAFYRAIQLYGFSRDFQARVDNISINNKSFVGPGVGTDTQAPLLYIKDFTIPGVKKAVTSVKYQGVDFHAPGTRDFGDSKNWAVTFYTDQNLIFKTWLQARLIESASNTPDSLNHIPDDKDYAQVSVYNDSLQKVASYKINGLFVIDVPSQTYDVSGGGKIQELKVVFGYQNWTTLPVRANLVKTSADLAITANSLLGI